MSVCYARVCVVFPSANGHVNRFRNISVNVICFNIYKNPVKWMPSLTHWGRVTHICVNKLAIVGSDNGLAPTRRQAIIWTNVGILLIEPLGTNFSEILIEIITFFSQENAFENVVRKLAAILSRPQCVNTLSTALYQLVRHSLKHNALIKFVKHKKRLFRRRCRRSFCTKF